jgi:hypothetical protein
MAKHGENHPLWPSILGLIAAAFALAALLLLLFGYPQWRP